MVEILQPLEVGDGDTSGVDVHIRDDQAPVGLQDLVSSRSDWAVGRLGDDLCLDLVRVPRVDHLLHGGRHEDVAGLVHDVLTGVLLSSRKANNGAVFKFPVLQGLWIDSVRIVDRSVPLGNAHTGCPSSGQVAASMEADVAKTLHNIRLAAPARRLPDHRHVVRLLDEVVDPVEDASPSCRSPAMDSSLIDRFACHTGRCIEIPVADCVRKSIGYPGHLPFACAHVRRRYVNRRSQETLFSELKGKPACDLLQLVLAVQLGVDRDASFSSAKRHVNTGALVRHESREGLHFISTDVEGVSNTSLARTSVVRVLSSEALDHLVLAVVPQEGKVDLDDVGARLDDPQDSVRFLQLLFSRCPDAFHLLINERIFCFDAGLVEEVFNALEEARVLQKTEFKK